MALITITVAVVFSLFTLLAAFIPALRKKLLSTLRYILPPVLAPKFLVPSPDEGGGKSPVIDEEALSPHPPPSEENVQPDVFVMGVFTLLSMLAGVLNVTETSISSALVVTTGSQWWASAILGTNFAVAATLLAGLVPGPPIRRGVALMFRDISTEPKKAVVLFVFMLDVVYVTSIVFAGPTVGMSRLFVGQASGQILTSLFVDTYGLLWSPKRSENGASWVGAIVSVLGALVFQSEAFAANDLSAVEWAGVFLGFVAGIAMTISGCMRNLTKNYIGVFATLTFHGMLTSAMLWMLLLSSGDAVNRDLNVTDWWKFTSFFFGISGVSISVQVFQRIGFQVFSTASTAAALITSLIYDSQGWLMLEIRPVSGHRIFGVVVLLIGVSLNWWGRNIVIYKGVTKNGDVAPSKENEEETIGQGEGREDIQEREREATEDWKESRNREEGGMREQSKITTE